MTELNISCAEEVCCTDGSSRDCSSRDCASRDCSSRDDTCDRTNTNIKFKAVTIGNTVLPHGLLLAPMAGVTDAAFRAVCRAFGAEYTVTEMISAKALWYHDKKTAVLARIAEEEMPCAVQIFGSEPSVMAYAAKVLSDPDSTPCTRTPAAIDINMGCPMPKIVNNGDGSALMRNPVLAGQIIEAVLGATELPVTVKIRTGWSEQEKNGVEIAKIAAALGVSAITIHGRTRTQMYAPPVDFDSIAAVCAAVKTVNCRIPVIGNGSIDSAAAARDMRQKTGCDGVMIARGAYGNPWIFREIAADMDGIPFCPPTPVERLGTALSHLERLLVQKGDYTGIQEGRKHLAWYTKGLPGSASLRAQIMQAQTPDEMRAVLIPFLNACEQTQAAIEPPQPQAFSEQDGDTQA